MTSPPLGDAEFGHLNGPNLHRLPAEGNAASQLLQRALMQRTGERIVSDVTGNFKAILASKEVCNDVMVVFLGDDRSLVYLPIGQSFNISLAHSLNVARLYDQIAVVVTTPAPVALKNTRPTTSASFWIERNFKKTTRQALMIFPGDVVNAIEILKTRLASFDALGSTDPEKLEDHLIVQEKFDKVSREILAALSECFSAPAYTLKKSFEQGVVDEAFMVLVNSSMPYALANVTQRFTTSMAEGSTAGDWENNLQLQKVLSKEYAKKQCETAFLLSKDPERFLPDLIEVGMSMVKKIAHMPNNAVVYDQKTGTLFKLEGSIHLGNQAFRFVTTEPSTSTQLRSGYLVDRKPAFYKPMQAFLENDSTRSVLMLYEDEQHDRDKAALEEIVRTIREKNLFPSNRTQGQGVVRLSDVAKKLLAGKKLEENTTRRSTQNQYKFGAYDVKEPCLFVLHRGKAYIVDRTREYMPLRDQPDFYGRSPSLVSLKHDLFRVTLGDMDDSNDDLSKWISNAVTSGNKTASHVEMEPHKRLCIKSVTMHTPGLSPQCLTFGPNELRTVLMDPALYDATKQETALNYNLANLATRNETDLHFLKSLFSRKLTAADKARSLFQSYYEDRTATGDVHARGQNSLMALRSIQLNPFFDVRTRSVPGSGKKQFAFKKRDIYLQIPPFEMSPRVVEQRGLFLLAKGARENEIYSLNQTLSETVLPKDKYEIHTTALPQNIIMVAKCLSAMFKKVFGRSVFAQEGINFLHKPLVWENNDNDKSMVDNWLILKYVLLPVVKRGGVTFKTVSTTPGVLDSDVVTITPTATEFNMFAEDDLFRDNYVMSANTHLIVSKTNWPPILQAAALIMQYCLLTPTALSAVISEECHPGFAVDFIRHEPIYSEQAVFTTVSSHEMILSPGGVKEKEKGDGSIDLVVRGDIHTTRNTLGAGAVIVPSAYPNENGIPRAQNAAGKPIITRDGITRTDYGSLSNALADITTLSDADKKVVRDQLGMTTRHKHMFAHTTGNSDSRYPDEFVPVIRPVARPTHELRPVMGIEMSACMPLVGSNNSGWENFYMSGEPSTNPYASEMGSLYSMRYTKDNTAILPGSRSFLLRTTDIPQPEICCSTTAVFEELYDMSFSPGILTPHEKSFITLNSAHHFETSYGTIFKTDIGDPDVSGRPLLGKLDVPAAMGFSVPYTQTTDPTLCFDPTVCVGYNPAGLTKILKGPNDYYISSPFTVPPHSKT